MKRLEITEKNKRYKRVTRLMAKKGYIEGRRIIISASHIRPFNFMGIGYAELLRSEREKYVIDEIGVANDFDELVNSFSYYNCSTETGKEVFFWMEECI